MWGLEYALLFGAGKLELVDGKTRCAFPFRSREQAELHFENWVETLCRWKSIAKQPEVRRQGTNWYIELQDFSLEVYPRPIELFVPLGGEPFLTLQDAFWRRDFWSMQPAGYEKGWESLWRHGDLRMNLWTLFEGLCERHGGIHSSRVDISLSDTAAVAPDCFWYSRSRKECMIEDDYFRGPPDVIAEVLSPATRTAENGARRAVFARAGVPQLWLLEPLLETLEIHHLSGGDYVQAASYRSGQLFEPNLFPGEAIEVEPLFNDQWKRHGRNTTSEAPEPIPEWLLPRDMPLGLEHLMLLGHPERRSEIWKNRAPCVLAFGSVTEAEWRFRHFVEEAARWERMEEATVSQMGNQEEQGEVGRFRLTRRGRLVYLDVAVDGRKYRDLLHVWADREAWDWGEQTIR